MKSYRVSVSLQHIHGNIVLKLLQATALGTDPVGVHRFSTVQYRADLVRRAQGTEKVRTLSYNSCMKICAVLHVCVFLSADTL